MLKFVVVNRETFCWGAWLCLVVACADASCPSGTTEMNGRCLPVAGMGMDAPSVASGVGGVESAVSGSGGVLASGHAAGASGSSGQEAPPNRSGTGGAGPQSSSSNAGEPAAGSSGSGAEPQPSGSAGTDAKPSSAEAAGAGGDGASMPEPDGTPPCVAAEEVCDAIDNDCDGMMDEMVTRSCGPEMPRGQCKAGVDTCVAGMWTGCIGAVEATMEVCDEAKLDENCDGTPNDGCNCVMGETQECGTDEGICSKGTQTCMSGAWDGPCEGKVDPMTAEVCDQAEQDENCDGEANPECECFVGQSPRPCPGGTETGECSAGTQACNSGRWGACSGMRRAQTESCDGDDDNCNGTNDDSPSDCRSPMTCRNGRCEECSNGDEEECPTPGACVPRTRRCSNGTWGECTGGTICDGEEECVDGVCELPENPCGNGQMDSGEDCDPSMPDGNEVCNSDCSLKAFKSCGSPGGSCSPPSAGVCESYLQFNAGGGMTVFDPVCAPGCVVDSDCPVVGDHMTVCVLNYCAIVCLDGQCPRGMECQTIENYDIGGARQNPVWACVP